MTAPRWQNCVSHGDAEAEAFIKEYFSREDRSCLLVAGAGFDPRSAVIPTLLSDATAGEKADRLQAIFIREHRPNPDTELLNAGNRHAELLQRTIANSRVVDVNVLSESDGAVVGGLRVITEMRILGPALFEGKTDIVLDMSALSIGIAFPLASYFVTACEDAKEPLNFHVVTASDPFLDEAITAISSDVVDPVRGFSGEIDFQGNATEPKVWLPHLARNRVRTLQLILDKLQGPVAVCPVLPLSQRDPKAADRLIAEYENELYEGWGVDPRNLIYAIEDDPLDLYRTITSIYRRTQSVFKAVAKPHLVLSPSGNKVLAIGALMAALEHKIAVRYVESVGYEVDWDRVRAVGGGSGRLLHVWLEGEPYAEVAAPESPGGDEQAGSAAA
jgi:hypothetical protein